MSTSNTQSRIAWMPGLRNGFKGRVIAPEEAGYDEARTPFYGGIDRRPALIVQVRDADDVARAIVMARENDLEIAVQSGGHSIAGHGVTDGGIMVDLSQMRALEADVKNRTAWAESGLTAGEYTNTVATHGLATGFGDTASVGIGGLTLGGGIGYLVRKHGLTIDSLLAAEIVTADAILRRVDAETEPDLFWAIRGGGGNFGIATRFKYRLQEVDSVVGGTLVLPATPEAIIRFIAEAQAAPEELSTIANVMTAPPMPFLPKELHGKVVLMTTLVYAGEVDAGERVVGRLRGIAKPLADLVRPMHYPEIYGTERPGYHPLSAARTMFVDHMGQVEAETMLSSIGSSTASMSVAQLRVLGGAVAQVPADATAFAHRESPIMVNVAAIYQRPEEKAVHESWVTGLAAALKQNDNGTYVNFLGDEGEARVRAAYPAETWERLAAIKAIYDPTNLFHLNQNIPPAVKTDRTAGPPRK